MATVFAKSSITTAVAITSTSTPLVYGVAVKAAAANTDKVHVGLSNAVTANSADSTDGWQLSAGDEIFIPVAMFPGNAPNATSVFVIAAGGTQKVFCIAV